MNTASELAMQDTIYENSLDRLLEDVLKRTPYPRDSYEIAAILESMGWNDKLAAEMFGAENVFELAGDIWRVIQSRVLVVPASPVEKISALQYIILVVRSFLRGTIFALPMAVSVAAMLTLRYSLWSYENLSLENATSIAIGTILSFVTVGGFTQAIARRGFMYLGQGHYYMARRISFHFVRIGYIVCILNALLFLGFNSFFTVYPWRMTIIVVLYFMFLSAIWLSVTIMYMLQKELLFTVLITCGIIIVFICFELLGLNIIVSQLVALTLVSLAAIITAYYYFVRAERKMEKGIAPQMPRLSIIVYTCIPYFLYGFLYFSFLFADRVVAWSANDVFMPYLVWFRGEYELGLDFALISMIIPMGVAEVVVNELMSNLEANQKNFMAEDASRMNRMYLSMYIKRALVMVVFSLVSAVLLYLALRVMSGAGLLRLDIFISDVTHFVFLLAALSYALLSVGLMNALVLFCLAQPERVCRSILTALLANISLGFVLSRWVDYSWAVIGLLAGAVVFSYLTAKNVLEVLNKLDYYQYYAA